jgi:hypothetical protein
MYDDVTRAGHLLTTEDPCRLKEERSLRAAGTSFGGSGGPQSLLVGMSSLLPTSSWRGQCKLLAVRMQALAIPEAGNSLKK